MPAYALSVLSGLAAVVLLAGCGHVDRVAVLHDAGATAEPASVGQLLPAWHPALPEGHPPVQGMAPTLPQGHPPVLPEGHPPISDAGCPAAGMGGFRDTPAPEPTAPATIST